MLTSDLMVEGDAAEYRTLLERVPGALIHATPQWLDFLRESLPAASQACLLARRDGDLVGALPAFTTAGPHGAVVNALPYFGSHGDVLVAEGEDEPEVSGTLLRALGEMAREQDAVACNLVGHPFRVDDAPIIAAGLPKVDDRIGQISHLARANSHEAAIDAVLAQCRQKTRNLVRKGLKSGASIAISDEEIDWRNLHRHHVEGMARIGGAPKPWSQIEALRRSFAPDQRRLYVARKDGVFAGALLVLLHRRWVEYFMPVSVFQFRNEQVASAMIARAMADAMVDGAELWNWGGTWRTQAGVHHFKSGWGARDYPYGYYGWARRDLLPSAGEVVCAYPYFYLFPFGTD